MAHTVLRRTTYAAFRLFFLTLSKILFRYEVRGAEHVPRKSAAIIASNHVSYLDPIFIGIGIRRHIFYFAKEELFRNIVFGKIIDFVNAMPVNRERLDKKTLQKVFAILERGEILTMFPEGTRSPDGEIQQAKLGVGLIVYKTRVPVVPAYIKGSHEIFPRNSKILHLKKCVVSFGPPINLDQLCNQKKTKDLYGWIGKEIMNGITRLRDESCRD